MSCWVEFWRIECNKGDNIDAALVCEDRLREYTWTINAMRIQFNMLMQSWSYRSVGHIKFDPRAHVNHQQEDVKDELDVTLVYGERDFEDTKTGMFFSVTLNEDCGGFLPLYSSLTFTSWGSQMNVFLSEYNIFDSKYIPNRKDTERYKFIYGAACVWEKNKDKRPCHSRHFHADSWDFINVQLSAWASIVFKFYNWIQLHLQLY